jgi:hypothetical protein
MKDWKLFEGKIWGDLKEYSLLWKCITHYWQFKQQFHGIYEER